MSSSDLTSLLPSLPRSPELLAHELASDGLPEELVATLLPLGDSPSPFNLELIRHTLGFLAQPHLSDRSRRDYLLELRRFLVHRGLDLETVSAEALVRATDRSAVTAYLNFLSSTPRQEVPVASIRAPREDVAARRDGHQPRAPLSKASLRRRLAVVRGWLEYLASSGVIPRNEARGIKIKVRDVDRQRIPALSAREVRLLLDTLDSASDLVGFRDRAMVRMGLWLGLRRAELVSLRVSSLDQVGSLHRVIFGGKGGKVHRRTLPDPVLQPLMEYLGLRSKWAPNLQGAPLPGPSPLFARHGRSKDVGEEPAPGISTALVYQVIGKWMERSGVAEGRRRRGAPPLSPHSLRATHITFALRKFPLHVVQAAVGHANPATTFGYRDDRDEAGADPSLGLDFSEEL